MKNSIDLAGDLDEFLILLRGLVREPSVIGSEDAFFRVLRRELDELPIEVTRYHGLLVARGKAPKGQILSAHVDRHGLICTGPNEFQYAAFIIANRSEMTGDSVSEQTMELIADRFHGQRVQAHTPYAGSYLGQGTINRSFICPKRRNLIFEVSGLDFLQPGTPVSFLDRLTVSSGFVRAQLDNVLSVAMLVYLFRCGFQGTALFTAGEEAGRSWQHALAWFQRHDIATDRMIVLDTSPYSSEQDALAQHVVLRTRDATSTFASNVTQELESRCKTLGIEYTYKDKYVEMLNRSREKPLSFGRTELGRLIGATEGRITGTTLQVPTTGYHTANETASLESIQATLQLLKTYIR
ncbi:M42 glutamyl aminopeptidase [Rubripirellula tenax]|uniref:M42 glutamyl aminopeptidase n=1 Tax=Rubripirellula tenax TaxID=2528015 RepID=A0A5C6EBL8_9BACT|nr:peptidase M42 [Rubripirellula tenax]TWU46288.1 M42 glutamyl aminopeptidase [Rubripirellula tenax]